MGHPATSSHGSESGGKGPMLYLSTSEEGRTPRDVIVIGAVFPSLAAVFLGLRFYCRLRTTRAGLGADDWLMLAAFFLTLGMGIMLIVGAALHGLAQPTPEGWGPTDYFWVTNDAEIITEKIFWVFVMVQCLAFGLAKLSVLFFYRRIFCSKTFKNLNLALIVLVVMWTVGFFFAYLFRCGTNFWALWAPLKDLLANCYNSTPMFYTMAISDVVTDGMILALPLFWIWRLNMTTAKRFAVSGVFLLGATEIGTGIARLVVFVEQTTDYLKTADGIGLLTTMMVWSMIEMAIAVISGCLPTIWPLVSNIMIEDMFNSLRSVLSFERLRDSSRGSSRGSSRKTSGQDDRSSSHRSDNGNPEDSKEMGIVVNRELLVEDRRVSDV